MIVFDAVSPSKTGIFTSISTRSGCCAPAEFHRVQNPVARLTHNSKADVLKHGCDV